MSLTLLHTSDAHRQRFDMVRNRIAPDCPLTHVVREDWLAHARAQGVSPSLQAEIAQFVALTAKPVLCTCTTIAEAAEQAGAIRIDRPMMQAAARTGGPVLMAYCLDSTFQPSQSLLQQSLADSGKASEIRALKLDMFWPLFEAGETEAFAATVAAAVRDALIQRGEISCVVLAQASMADAADMLGGCGIPVFTSPETAFRAALATVDTVH